MATSVDQAPLSPRDPVRPRHGRIVRRRTHCYCDEGTFFAMIIGIVSAFWTFGPGVAMLFLIVRIRRKMQSGHCVQCGYDLRGQIELRCPECGRPFTRSVPLTPAV